MSIGVGDRVPSGGFKVISERGPTDRTSAEIFSGRKVVLFAVPGAFTPTCHLKHLPDYLENAQAILDKGIDEICCVAVNDPFVMKAWGDANQVDGRVTMLSDDNASFAKALGLEFDGSGAGLGVRSKRYAMLVDDGVVKALHIEEAPSTMDASRAANILASL
ncbi:MAG: peroxiredoxin [Pseudomonadota bacterium]